MAVGVCMSKGGMCVCVCICVCAVQMPLRAAAHAISVKACKRAHS